MVMETQPRWVNDTHRPLWVLTSALTEDIHQPTQCHYDEQKYVVEKCETKRSTAVHAQRGKTEEARVVRNRLMHAACLPPRARGTSGPKLLLSTVSGSVVLHRVCFAIHNPCWHQRTQRCSRSGPPPMAMLVSEGHADLSGLRCHPGP